MSLITMASPIILTLACLVGQGWVGVRVWLAAARLVSVEIAGGLNSVH